MLRNKKNAGSQVQHSIVVGIQGSYINESFVIKFSACWVMPTRAALCSRTLEEQLQRHQNPVIDDSSVPSPSTVQESMQPLPTENMTDQPVSPATVAQIERENIATTAEIVGEFNEPTSETTGAGKFTVCTNCCISTVYCVTSTVDKKMERKMVTLVLALFASWLCCKEDQNKKS